MKEKKYNRLRIVLAEKEKTQKQLSDFLNIGYVSVSRWCSNEVQPNIETFFKIADFLNVEVCDLFVKNEIKKTDGETNGLEDVLLGEDKTI